ASLNHVFLPCVSFFFFHDTATTEIYTLSLHDALPISRGTSGRRGSAIPNAARRSPRSGAASSRTAWGSRSSSSSAASTPTRFDRSEEHTSELQSRFDLVCRLLLEKKKKISTS